MSPQTFVGVILLWGACALFARGEKSVSLAWDASPDTNVIGYLLYYYDAAVPDLAFHDVGNETSMAVPGLTEGRTYNFFVTAYDRDGLESDPSSEVTYLVPGVVRHDVQIRRPSHSIPLGRLRFPVKPGHRYVIEASEDLISWTVLWFADSFTNEWIEYQDTGAALFQRRFYRVVLR